jgi:hypothetical protein
MSHGSEEGENYWPGYVDALTSMVQVLAFVMMMLAMAVFVLSQSVSKHAVEAIAKAVNADVKPNADVKQLTQAVLDKLQSNASVSPTTPDKSARAPADSSELRSDKIQIAGMRSRSDQAPAQIPANAPRITLNFEARSFTIEQDRAQSLAKFVDGNQVKDRKRVLTINAYAFTGEGAISEARRLAYYRAMMARKQLIDEKMRPENIRIIVSDTTEKDKGSTVDIVVTGNGAP